MHSDPRGQLPSSPPQTSYPASLHPYSSLFLCSLAPSSLSILCPLFPISNPCVLSTSPLPPFFLSSCLVRPFNEWLLITLSNEMRYFQLDTSWQCRLCVCVDVAEILFKHEVSGFFGHSFLFFSKNWPCRQPPLWSPWCEASLCLSCPARLRFMFNLSWTN